MSILQSNIIVHFGFTQQTSKLLFIVHATVGAATSRPQVMGLSETDKHNFQFSM